MERYFEALFSQPCTPSNEEELLNEIRATVKELNGARMWFESESDEDLIESCVHRIASLEAKYRYLLRTAKRCGLRCDAVTGRAAAGNGAEVSARSDVPAPSPL